MPTSASELLTRIKHGGTITTNELAVVRSRLGGEESLDDPYTLIHILWKAGNVADIPLVKSYLSYRPEDPNDEGMVRRIALQALAALDPTTDTFLIAHQMLDDDSKDVRMAAATIVGDLGRAIPALQKQAATALLEHFQRSLPPGAERDAYYDGLLSLLGVPEADRPLPTRALKESDIRREVIERAIAIANG
jgi:hypothetical protein